jgi:hypothetical protein
MGLESIVLAKPRAQKREKSCNSQRYGCASMFHDVPRFNSFQRAAAAILAAHAGVHVPPREVIP